MAKDKNEATEPKKVTRHQYKVLHAKNFGSGVIQPGNNVELSEKAGTFYGDKGIVKPIKK